MQEKYKYHQKNVYDIPVLDSFVRVWDGSGSPNRKFIEESFFHLIKTGFIYPYIALMPDYHPGEGSMIGSVISTRDVILLTVAGGDLGCGVTSLQMPAMAEEINSELPNIHKDLYAAIPTGSSSNSTISNRVEANPIWQRNIHAPLLSGKVLKKLTRQLGSMGGGNHFVELQKDPEGRLWVMLHSGSRYLGVILRDHYINMGLQEKGVNTDIYRKYPYLRSDSNLAEQYLSDLNYVLCFARESRKEMLHRVVEVLGSYHKLIARTSVEDLLSSRIDIFHNYVSKEEHFGEELFIHRKGAIRLSENDCGLIPGSMGSHSYVVKGRDNAYGYKSCSHGAGRKMSRGKAMKTITQKEYFKSMEGIVFNNSSRIKDEAPAAYKNIKQVMKGQKDLVRITHELTPLLSIKGME